MTRILWDPIQDDICNRYLTPRTRLQQVPDPANTGNASDHFWTLEKRIRQDKKNPGVLIEIRKSTAIWDIAYLVGDGVITMDELEGFGEELIDAVKLIL